MSLHLLEVEPLDVAAEALGLLLDAPVPATLAELEVRGGPGATLLLGVLGASHVVRATLPGRSMTEQVSCLALGAGGERLPAARRRGDYALRSRVERRSADELATLADRLRAFARDGDTRLCGAFPGSASALTALHAHPRPAGGWQWRTWHLYPGASAGVSAGSDGGVVGGSGRGVVGGSGGGVVGGSGGGVVVRTTSRWGP